MFASDSHSPGTHVYSSVRKPSGSILGEGFHGGKDDDWLVPAFTLLLPDVLQPLLLFFGAMDRVLVDRGMEDVASVLV